MSQRSHPGPWLAGQLAVCGALLSMMSACSSSEDAKSPPPRESSQARDASASAVVIVEASTTMTPDANTTMTPDARADDLAPPDTPLGEMQRLGTEPGDRARARELHSSALKRHRRRAYRNAEQIWLAAARADPSWNWPFYNLACATALQGRPDEAVAYLELVARRQVSYRRLRKIETDRDLVSIRDRAEVRRVVVQLAEQLLVGPHSAPEGTLPAGLTAAPSCETFTLHPAGTFVQQCADQYTSTGRWAYANGFLYLHIKAQQSACDGDEPCPPLALNDYVALEITRLDNQFVCVRNAVVRTKWPERRKPGQIISAPRRSIKDGCYE